MDVAGNFVIPVGIVISLVIGVLSWTRSNNNVHAIATLTEGQKKCHDCMAILVTESTKQTTLLEQIANSLTQQRR